MKSKTIIVLLMAVFLVLNTGFAAAQNFSIDAEIGLLFDYNSGQIIFSQNADQPWIPASLVKVMTMYVALDRIAAENIPLDKTFKVSEKAWQMGGSQMFLEVGEEVTIEDLLNGIAVVSGNDACITIAEGFAGTEELYVRWMNEKAEQLGLDLHFVDVHGLSEDNRITADDFALLVYNYIKDYPNALQYHSRLSFGYKPRSSANPIVQSNRNGLLRTYEGADGLKTGHLSEAGYNLVATAVQDNRRLIAIVLGAESELKREQEAAKALNYGFRSFENISADDLLTVQDARIYKGRKNYLPISTGGAQITINRGFQGDLKAKVEISVLEAPILIGEQVGELLIYTQAGLLNKVPLVAVETVERGNWFSVLIDTFILFFSKLFSKG
ncbi:MAG: D-alanyl-D-alanine carboxypeptidase [Firmicutes bacterium]|nr:D-alanyl-D-alanine carboxypeptidase [Bacillota bacterium]